MLEQDAVAGHEAGDGVTHRLVGREIPRLNAIHHADGLVGDDAGAIGRGALFIGEHLRALLGGVLADGHAQVHLAAAVTDQLADLIGHQLGEGFLLLFQLAGDGGHHFSALFQTAQAPLQERFVGGLYGVSRLGVGHVRVGVQHLFG